MDSTLFHIEELVAASVVAIALLILIRYFKNSYKKKMLELETGSTVFRVAISTARIIIYVIYAIFVMSIFGINVSSLLAGLGLVSVIVGLALQDTLKDVFMGIHIMIDHFFSVGDVVSYEGREYRVISFNLSTTKLGDSADHSIYSICNRDVSKIKRLAQRYDFDVPLPYSVTTAEANIILNQIKEKIMEIHGIEDVRIMGLETIGEYSKDYRIRVFCKPQIRCDVKRPINGIIVETIEENGVSIPFRTLTININD